ncbi:MAG TPA: hypothetical protein VFQ23_09075 [Anaerolineales bacterium]|nr:hypothetical protein [Anaerolineales bacterium]
MIVTLFTTILVEGAIVSGYSLWHRKPVESILFTSVFANLITQYLLWVVVNLFFQHYLTALLISEVLIWMIESLLLYRFAANRLGLQEAVLLSLFMNSASFGFGLFLPV